MFTEVSSPVKICSWCGGSRQSLGLRFLPLYLHSLACKEWALAEESGPSGFDLYEPDAIRLLLESDSPSEEAKAEPKLTTV